MLQKSINNSSLLLQQKFMFSLRHTPSMCNIITPLYEQQPLLLILFIKTKILTPLLTFKLCTMRNTLFRKCVNTRLCSIALLMFLLFPAMALRANPNQERTVSGVVTSSIDGEALIGVSVLVKGTSNGTITDFNGKYALNVRNGETLTFSYIGHLEQEIRVTNQSTINVVLSENTKELDEVIVIGYGVQKKKLNTGATVQMKGETLAKMNTTSALQAMQGQTPGVSIISISGQPGAEMKVTIRGLGTVGNAKPLYIIDGIEGDISVISASDIESIDILKDAASAAIYGAQAANGVVLVTTKQGSKSKGVVTFDAYYGVQNVARKTNLLNAEQYKIIMNEQAVNSGASLINFDAMQGLADTNWIDQMFKDDAKTENYAISINGGSESSAYSLSLNYLSQEGIVGGKEVSNYERYGFRINTEHKLYEEKLKVGQHLNFSWIRNSGIKVGNQFNNTLRSAFTTSPLSPVYSDNNLYGSPYNDTTHSPWNNADGNPYGAMMTDSNNKNATQRLIADIYAELEPIKNLKLRTVFGINYHSNDYRSYKPIYRFSIYSYNEDHTSVEQRASKGHTLTLTNTAGYDFTMGDHAFNALVGMEAKRYDGVGVGASNWNLLSQFNDFAHAYINNTTGVAHEKDDSIIDPKGVSGAPEVQFRSLSYFGRIGYNFQEKYMFNATLRADGSSNFAAGHRWGYFPSFSAGWVMTNEAFMKKTENWLNSLKLRVSWGQVGNQNIDPFQYASPISTSTNVSSSNPAANYIFGNGLGAGKNVKGSYPVRLSNADVKWETSEQTNIGIDARFLNNRLGVNADFYIKTTKDWLVEAPILATAGANAPYINGGNVKNSGVELALNWNDRIGKLNYDLGINGAYNKNKVGKIPTDDGIIHGPSNMLYNNSEEFYRAQNGHAIGYFWGYKTAGIFQNQADIDAWKAAGNGILQGDNVKPGDVKFVDQQKNGIIDINDKVDLGNGLPDFTYGFNVSLDYKGFDLAIYANGAVGNKIVQSYGGYAGRYENYTTAVLSRWTGEGSSNRMPRVTNTNINWQFSDLYLQDGDYLRISNITLGYDFSKLLNWKYISQCRLYASIQNALTFTKYDGMDPEIGYGTDGWVSGVDLGYYPRPRTFLFGVNIKF